MNQTYQNLEIILVDDGSPDNCGKICDFFAQQDKRIIVIHQENAGLAAARNAGLAMATGELIGFVDSDDWIENETFAKAVAAMKENIDLVCWSVSVESEDYGEEALTEYKNYHKLKNFGLQKADSSVGASTTVTVWSKCYRKSIIDKYGIVFPMGKIYEDTAFFAMYFVHCKNVYYIDDNLYHYIVRKGSIMNNTHDFKDTETLDALYVFDEIYTHFQKYNMFEDWKEFLTSKYGQCLKNGFRWSDYKKKFLFLAKATELAQAYDSANFTTTTIEFVKRGDYINIPEINVYKERAEQFQQEIYLQRFLKSKQEERTEIIQKRVYKERYEKTQLQKKLEQQEKANEIELKNLQEKLKQEQNETKKLLLRLDKLEKENSKTKKQLQDIKNSVSFKFGRIITWLPRKLKGFLN